MECSRDSHGPLAPTPGSPGADGPGGTHGPRGPRGTHGPRGPGVRAPQALAMDVGSVPASGARGLAIRGQHFYVWDEDPREASRWGGELASFEGARRREGG
jgi:hypothetical protein